MLRSAGKRRGSKQEAPAGGWLLTPIILATQEAEIRRIFLGK
jgi:hypothetical protein